MVLPRQNWKMKLGLGTQHSVRPDENDVDFISCDHSVSSLHVIYHKYSHN